MSEHQGLERRTSKRKKCKLPIKFTAGGDLTIIGFVADISCYGLKVDITFKAKNNDRRVDKLLFNPDVTLEMVEIGDKNPLRINAPLDIIWNKYICVNDNQIYEIGFAFNLNENQQQLWKEFYSSLD